jgi:hypothetical protein
VALDKKVEATYRAIGRFMCEFSQLEYAIRAVVSDESGLDDIHFNAIMVHDFSVLCTGAIEVFFIGKEANKTEMRKLLNQARSLGDVRNRIAHGLWVAHLDGGRVIHVPRNSLKGKIFKDQAKELEKKADEANALRTKIERLVTDW